MAQKTISQLIDELTWFDLVNKLKKILKGFVDNLVGGSTFIEEGDNVTITGNGEEATPYIISADGGIGEAPLDGGPYGRQAGSWVEVSVDDELTSDELAGIQNANGLSAVNPVATMGDIPSTPTLQQVTTVGNTSNKDIELAFSANQKTSIKSYGSIDLQTSFGKAALNSQGLAIYENGSSTNSYTFKYSRFSFNTSGGAVTYYLPTQADYNSTSINNIAIVGRKPVKTISTTTYSLVYNDRNNILLFTHPAGCTITISSGDLASTRTNNHYYGLQLGGKLTFIPQTGITLTGSTETLGVGCRFEINFIANENFHISVTPTKEYNDKQTLTSYTVATLPASPTTGDQAAVTDADTPTYLGIVAGGGTTYCPVVYNGTNWVCH